MMLSAPSRSQDAVVKSTLDPAKGAVVGQAVSLYVDVLFPDAMPRPPRVRIPDTPGTQIMRSESQGVTIRENIAGVNYVGQRFTFEVFPRRGGPFTIPGAEVALLDTEGNPSGAVKGSPVAMDVGVPPGIDASGPVIASTRVTASQAWSPDPATRFAEGGAISRTITREATDVPSLGMSGFTFTAPDGVRAYVDPPAGDDHVNRGSLSGHRSTRSPTCSSGPARSTFQACRSPGGTSGRSRSGPWLSRA